jgi:hypothetical protein
VPAGALVGITDPFSQNGKDVRKNEINTNRSMAGESIFSNQSANFYD